MNPKLNKNWNGNNFQTNISLHLRAQHCSGTEYNKSDNAEVGVKDKHTINQPSTGNDLGHEHLIKCLHYMHLIIHAPMTTVHEPM